MLGTLANVSSSGGALVTGETALSVLQGLSSVAATAGSTGDYSSLLSIVGALTGSLSQTTSVPGEEAIVLASSNFSVRRRGATHMRVLLRRLHLLRCVCWSRLTEVLCSASTQQLLRDKLTVVVFAPFRSDLALNHTLCCLLTDPLPGHFRRFRSSSSRCQSS